MLNAHTDTVGVAGMVDPFVPRLDDGRLYGRGALRHEGQPRRLHGRHGRGRRRVGFAATSSSRPSPTRSSRASARRRSRYQLRADAAIVTEPTEMQVAVAHRGFVRFEIETSGRAAHGSRPHLGIDAIAKMGRVLVGIEQLDRRLRASPTHPYLGSGSVARVAHRGRAGVLELPGALLLQAERRTIPGETVELVEGELKEIVARAGAGDPDFVAEVRVLASREPFEVESDAELVRAVRVHAAAVLGCGAGYRRRVVLGRLGAARRGRDPDRALRPARRGCSRRGRVGRRRDLERCAEIYVAVAAEFCVALAREKGGDGRARLLEGVPEDRVAPGTTTTSSRSPSAALCASRRWSYGRYEVLPRTRSVGTRTSSKRGAAKPSPRRQRPPRSGSSGT